MLLRRSRQPQLMTEFWSTNWSIIFWMLCYHLKEFLSKKTSQVDRQSPTERVKPLMHFFCFAFRIHLTINFSFAASAGIRFRRRKIWATSSCWSTRSWRRKRKTIICWTIWLANKESVIDGSSDWSLTQLPFDGCFLANQIIDCLLCKVKLTWHIWRCKLKERNKNSPFRNWNIKTPSESWQFASLSHFDFNDVRWQLNVKEKLLAAPSGALWLKRALLCGHWIMKSVKRVNMSLSPFVW